MFVDYGDNVITMRSSQTINALCFHYIDCYRHINITVNLIQLHLYKLLQIMRIQNNGVKFVEILDSGL